MKNLFCLLTAIVAFNASAAFANDEATGETTTTEKEVVTVEVEVSVEAAAE